MIKFKCSCGYEVEAPDEAAGMPGQCPFCKVVLTIPNVTVPEKKDTYPRSAPPLYRPVKNNGKLRSFMGEDEDASIDIAKKDTKIASRRKSGMPFYAYILLSVAVLGGVAFLWLSVFSAQKDWDSFTDRINVLLVSAEEDFEAKKFAESMATLEQVESEIAIVEDESFPEEPPPESQVSLFRDKLRELVFKVKREMKKLAKVSPGPVTEKSRVNLPVKATAPDENEQSALRVIKEAEVEEANRHFASAYGKFVEAKGFTAKIKDDSVRNQLAARLSQKLSSDDMLRVNDQRWEYNKNSKSWFFKINDKWYHEGEIVRQGSDWGLRSAMNKVLPRRTVAARNPSRFRPVAETHEYYRGVWMPKKQADEYRSKGLLEYCGQWITAEEKRRLVTSNKFWSIRSRAWIGYDELMKEAGNEKYIAGGKEYWFKKADLEGLKSGKMFLVDDDGGQKRIISQKENEALEKGVLVWHEGKLVEMVVKLQKEGRLPANAELESLRIAYEAGKAFYDKQQYADAWGKWRQLDDDKYERFLDDFFKIVDVKSRAKYNEIRKIALSRMRCESCKIPEGRVECRVCKKFGGEISILDLERAICEKCGGVGWTPCKECLRPGVAAFWQTDKKYFADLKGRIIATQERVRRTKGLEEFKFAVVYTTHEFVLISDHSAPLAKQWLLDCDRVYVDITKTLRLSGSAGVLGRVETYYIKSPGVLSAVLRQSSGGQYFGSVSGNAGYHAVYYAGAGVVPVIVVDYTETDRKKLTPDYRTSRKAGFAWALGMIVAKKVCNKFYNKLVSRGASYWLSDGLGYFFAFSQDRRSAEKKNLEKLLADAGKDEKNKIKDLEKFISGAYTPSGARAHYPAEAWSFVNYLSTRSKLHVIIEEIADGISPLESVKNAFSIKNDRDWGRLMRNWRNTITR